MKFNKKQYRYSVILLKFAIGFVACLLIIGFAYKALHTSSLYVEADDAEHREQMQYGIAVINTMFEGFDERGRRYNIASKSTLKTNDGLYHMQNIIGKYNLGTETLNIASLIGSMNDANKMLQLTNNIVMVYNGYLLHANQLDIDLKRSIYRSDNVVTLWHANSTITANKFVAESEANTIRFEGNVITQLRITDF